MREPTSCPSCNANFRGDEIPEKYRDFYGGETHYSRVIGLTDMHTDATTRWLCPDCKFIWPRA